MGEQQVLVELEQRPAKPRQAVPVDQLQLRQPNRDQFTYAAIDVERLVPADHLVRAIWELSGMLDLSGFAAHLETRKESAGRPAWDPRLLVAIWIWAYSERMSSAREIARQSRYRPELEWLCGMAVVNHHTLSDFRVFHSKALENLLTQVLALLSQEGLVDLEQVAVDGTRIRAQASGGSQRRRPTLERHLEQAREASLRFRHRGYLRDDRPTARGVRPHRQHAGLHRCKRPHRIDDLRDAGAGAGQGLGAMLSGKPSDVLGRRKTLSWIAVLYFVSAVGCAIAWDWYSLLVFRLIGGLGVGASSVVAPMYIAEISPAAFRGRLVAITQFNIVLGILVAYMSNYLVAQMAYGAAEWRVMFGIEAVPAAIFFVFFVCCSALRAVRVGWWRRGVAMRP